MKLQIFDFLGEVSEETPEEAFSAIVENDRLLREDEDAGIEQSMEIVSRVRALLAAGRLALSS